MPEESGQQPLIDLLAEVGAEHGEAFKEQALTIQGWVRDRLAELESSPPTTEEQRAALIANRARFWEIANTRLATVAEGCGHAQSLILARDELEAKDQVTVLQRQIAVVLEAHAEMARACGAVLDLCLRIDDALEDDS